MKLNKKCIVILGVLAGFFALPGFAQESCLSSREQITNEFLGSLVQDTEQGTILAGLVKNKETGILKSSLVEYYCDTWLQTHSLAQDDVPDMNNRCADSGNMRFDPRQSLFMYGLCVGYDEGHKGKKSFKDNETYIHRDRKNDVFKKLEYVLPTDSKGNKNAKIQEDISKYIPKDSADAKLLQERRGLDKENDACQPEKGMTECMMGFPTKNILTTIFNGLFDLKKASIDGYNHGTEDEDITLAIKDFSISLFDQISPDRTVCLDENKQYLMEQDFGANDKQSHCGHLKTRGEVKSLIQAAIKDVDRVTELDGHAIAEAECKGIRETIIPCAMSNIEANTEGKQDVIFASEERSWRNLILNELFFANLWVDYYTMIIESEPSRQLQEGGSVLDKNLRIDFEIKAMQNDMALIESSIDRLMNMLGQYRTSLHQCITLKAHQEDLHYYRARLNKMYPSVHQLQQTTQDAQEQDA